jgi:glycosyltransferase involved in cell wall biosynthesis
MVLNVHYAPQSFGGATVVAEQLTRHLHENHHWQVLVVTTHIDPTVPSYSLRRYSTNGCDVVSINLPVQLDYESTWRNPSIDRAIGKLLEVFKPDLVHCHAVQNLGAGYFELVKAAGVPLVVTVHDNWWLCDRQFMISGYGRYCYQTKIDPERCRYCVDHPGRFEERNGYLRSQLMLADRILAPSQFQCDLYRANGFPKNRCQVNENGIVRPGNAATRSARDKVQIGFIGGPGDVKGADVIVAALQDLGPDAGYRLLVVDAAQNVGSSWFSQSQWDIPGELKLVPAYNQSNIDEFFAQIDVLLFPSQWRESFGLTVREALARDVWVIGTGEGGVGEAIVDGQNGHALPLSRDPQYLQTALAECLREPGRWADYSNPRKSDIRWFDEQAAELDSLYCELTGNHS